MKKQLYNLLFEINNDVLTLTDAKTGLTRNWKIKVDPFCGYCYQIQKKQIKTLYEDKAEFLNVLTDIRFSFWFNRIGFNLDFKYNA